MRNLPVWYRVEVREAGHKVRLGMAKEEGNDYWVRFDNGDCYTVRGRYVKIVKPEAGVQHKNPAAIWLPL